MCNILFTVYFDVGDPDIKCEYCLAFMWANERARKDGSLKNAKFSLCCMKGKVQIPTLKNPPRFLEDLLSRKDSRSRYFVENIRAFNMMFAFTSMRGRVDNTVNKGRGPYCFRLGGQNYHRIGSLLPTEGNTAKFQQLYIVDTENEIENRKRAFR
ncbi:uncharacterized protein LOC130824877 [Amaranthus tricolor]|uniref:uncharacterized protein LOC130824877 n=1 Tax=Amaranthus tricolor TaxID=29722 RepID=UPI002584CCF3|nr:uncharacterized protein LOC130824877 [Amaranthus tricolor]